ncbi:MAG: ATP-binding protein [Methanocellales archaeon]|nr:ATP-binding protein [Methanocellales archaeon]
MTEERGKMDLIDAAPTKRLFIDILTRDISVKACILDLIDNSVDAYIRNELTDRREIRLIICKDKFTIFDNCGGIEYNFLKDKVFRFGADLFETDSPTLGIYGIGLKRAILKIGKKILMETDDGNSFCKIDFDVNEWQKSDDWKIPFEYFENSKLSPDEKPYTKIVVKDLHDNIKKKFDLDSFITDIKETIHITYTIFISNNIDFYVNDDNRIEPYILEARYDERYSPVKSRDSIEGVDFEIVCFIDPIEGRAKRELGKRGWNIFCNKRLILVEDTTETTGWTGSREDLPKYHSIYNEFRGAVFIESKDPSKLPLNTSKTGLDTETSVYNYILNKMVITARPLIDHLSRKYDEEKDTLDEIENKVQKDELVEEGGLVGAKYVNLDQIEVGTEFKAPERPKPKIKMATIIYKKPEKIVKKLKERFGVRSNTKVGEETFEYYIDTEEIEDD